ncbi:7cd7d0c9-9f43-4f51-b542-7d43e2b14074 [Thermothielavioides terrestris]|uniref:7cd7d0c9-9f43-4f51-b542-7d43e2b14074 n=1 Tax=Thermothielavioides terrestris TaxID=2587410 RepID=A0A446BIU6_9PEZI|nr:7cd7d0c9-9f43-4f51-b542-7d43e2b14074 [Thermothielavioides terrestris]
MQNLEKCTRNPRFAEAMLAGYLEPAQLASLTRMEMDGITTSLNSMTEAEFKQRVWTTKADLSISTKTRKGRGNAVGSADVNGSPRERGHRGVLRFITSPEPEESQPVTPQDRGGDARPGDSADTPQIIDLT